MNDDIAIGVGFLGLAAIGTFIVFAPRDIVSFVMPFIVLGAIVGCGFSLIVIGIRKQRHK